jgi:flagellar assembly factor FliW
MHAKDQVYVLSVLSKNGNNWTTNLKSPVILNSTRRLAVQVVVIDEQPLTQPIILTDALELQKVA